jgi:hypothetical protein
MSQSKTAGGRQNNKHARGPKIKAHLSTSHQATRASVGYLLSVEQEHQQKPNPQKTSRTAFVTPNNPHGPHGPSYESRDEKYYINSIS